jgi:phage terminase large subunit-like protein
LLHVVEGAIVGADAIVKHIVGRDGKSGMLARFPRLKGAQFAYDPAFATEVALSLRDGYGLTVVEVLQNYKHLSEACQVFEALVKAKRIIHGGHRLLRWNVENVAIRRDDAGRIRPVKPRRATKRIDGVIAAIMAISRLMLLPAPRSGPRKGARIWTPGGFKPAVDSTGGDHARA